MQLLCSMGSPIVISISTPEHASSNKQLGRICPSYFAESFQHFRHSRLNRLGHSSPASHSNPPLAQALNYRPGSCTASSDTHLRGVNNQNQKQKPFSDIPASLTSSAAWTADPCISGRRPRNANEGSARSSYDSGPSRRHFVESQEVRQAPRVVKGSKKEDEQF